MKVVFDVECNSLIKPSKIWCVVCKDIATSDRSIFRNLHEDEDERNRFLAYAAIVTGWIGHNCLDYDHPVLARIARLDINDVSECTTDTLILSRLIDYSREGGHSIEQYGIEQGLQKIKFSDFTRWSQELEDYCVRDVDICHNIYNKYSRQINDPAWKDSIELEHQFQWWVVNKLRDNGFAFNKAEAEKLLGKVISNLGILDKDILEAFPPKEVLIREFIPKATKFGTISRTSVPRSLHEKIHEYEVGQTYKHTKLEPFNPASHKQLIEVLNAAGWVPEDKTKAHIESERELGRLKRQKGSASEVDIADVSAKLERLKRTGWKVNENNLNTLPETAPKPARLLAKRILLESRRRSLVEWTGLVQEDGRIHGKFQGIGAWTHRMAHQNPNTANIPSALDINGKPKLLGKEMRKLWISPKGKLLVGVDAEGIQLRIFAHYIDDPEFTKALVEGKKDAKTDPHSLNQTILGDVCKSRQSAKRFIYAKLLGAGLWKLAQILECSESQTKEALARLLQRYAGLANLQDNIIPKDARRGFFIGLDGRRVSIPGDTEGQRRHLCMSGYLQTGEAVVIKTASLQLAKHFEKESRWKLVNVVHDELIAETSNSMDFAIPVAKITADAIRLAGEKLKLKCPLAGSYWNDDIKDYTIGTNWYATH